MFQLQVPAETPSGAYRTAASMPGGELLRCGLWANGGAAWGGGGAGTPASGVPTDKENLPPRAPALDVVDVQYRRAAAATAAWRWHAFILQVNSVRTLCGKLEVRLASAPAYLPRGEIVRSSTACLGTAQQGDRTGQGAQGRARSRARRGTEGHLHLPCISQSVSTPGSNSNCDPSRLGAVEGALGAVEGELAELRGLGTQLENWRQHMDAASTQAHSLREYCN